MNPTNNVRLFSLYAAIFGIRLRKKESRSTKILSPPGLPDILLAAAIMILYSTNGKWY